VALEATCDGGVTESQYVNFWWWNAVGGQTVVGPDSARDNHQYHYVRRSDPGADVVGNTFRWDLDTTDESLISTTYDWDGEWRMRAACKDAAGNYRHAEINVVVDNVPPVVTVNTLTTTDTTPALSGTVDDATATVTVTVGGNTYTATNNGDGTWTLADNTVSPALAVGTYDVVAH